jgi:putative FmdB family regulatory protein
MPTYEYRCEKGHPFERIQKMNDKPVTKCPVCGAKASRIISGGQGVIFKGTGFYITDYGKDGKGARKDPDGSSSSESKSDAKSDAKPGESATKAESKPETKPINSPKPGKPDAS